MVCEVPFTICRSYATSSSIRTPNTHINHTYLTEIRGICAVLGTSLTSATGTSRSGSATNTLSDTASRTTITSVPTATSPSRTTISPSTGTTSNAQATGGAGDELNPTDSPNSAVGNLVGGGLLSVMVGVGVVFGVVGL